MKAYAFRAGAVLCLVPGLAMLTVGWALITLGGVLVDMAYEAEDPEVAP